MKNDRKILTLSIAILLVLLAILAVIKINNKPNEPENNTVKEATQEEIIKEEEKEDEEIIEEPLPIPELPEQEPEEPEIILLTPQEQARVDLVDKYGEEVVDAWERLSRDEFFDYIGYKMVVQQHYGPEGEMYYHCYKILEDGTMKDAYVGGSYYVYGVYVSDEAMFDLVDYHNNFFVEPQN